MPRVAFPGNATLLADLPFIGFRVDAFAIIPYAQLRAVDHPHVVARRYLVEVLPYLAALYLGLHFLGLPSAATVFGLRTFADCVLLMYFASNLRLSASLLATPTVLLLASLGAARGWMVGSAGWWVSASILMLAALWWAWHHAPPDIRALAMRMLRSLPSLKSESAK